MLCCERATAWSGQRVAAWQLGHLLDSSADSSRGICWTAELRKLKWHSCMTVCVARALFVLALNSYGHS
jgi:hypothetical protein